MCHPGTNGVDGSTIAHACFTNSPKKRVASSRSISWRSNGLVSNVAKLFEFFIAQLGKIRPGGNLNRSAGQSGVFGIHDIPVTEQVLRQEDRSCDISIAREAEKTPADRYP